VPLVGVSKHWIPDLQTPQQQPGRVQPEEHSWLPLHRGMPAATAQLRSPSVLQPMDAGRTMLDSPANPNCAQNCCKVKTQHGLMSM